MSKQSTIKIYKNGKFIDTINIDDDKKQKTITSLYEKYFLWKEKMDLGILKVKISKLNDHIDAYTKHRCTMWDLTENIYEYYYSID